MRCYDLEPVLAGWLYREISPAEEETLKRHLERCESCRGQIERLERVRTLLREARPDVPAAPRILLLRPRRAPVWAVAAALAGAAVLASASAFLAGRASLQSPAASTARTDPAAPVPRPVAARQGEPSGDVLPAHQVRDLVAEVAVTQQDLDRRLAQLERRLQRQREADLRAVFEEIAGLEQRTSARIARTRDALRYVALASNPAISEQ